MSAYPALNNGKMQRDTTSKCAWTEDSDGTWNTDCGNSFQFNDGKPRDNGARFCLYCGLRLKQESHRGPRI